MNIYSLIKKDHDEAREIMEEIMAAKDNPDECEQLIEELKVAILAHAKSEEKIFYSALKETGEEELVEEVPHFIKEHKEVEQMFEEIGELEATDPLWWERFGAIRQALMHHMEEEEQDVFKEAKQEIKAEEAKELGMEMEELEEKVKQRLMKEAA
ncbi:MAG: hypothetical protein EBV03_09760 [Proteobacteria bacterium]|nr:hypothetical protein [Pseudomonadota bacterium]